MITIFFVKCNKKSKKAHILGAYEFLLKVIDPNERSCEKCPTPFSSRHKAQVKVLSAQLLTIRL